MFRKLSFAEQNYNIYDKKLLMIITALKTWKIYVKEMINLEIYINYKNLIEFTITKQLNQKQIKWLKLLEQ